MSGNLIIEDSGKISLPEEVRNHYGLMAETPIRIIETRGDILLVPLINEPMSESLACELDDWQSLGIVSLEMFLYI